MGSTERTYSPMPKVRFLGPKMPLSATGAAALVALTTLVPAAFFFAIAVHMCVGKEVYKEGLGEHTW